MDKFTNLLKIANEQQEIIKKIIKNKSANKKSEIIYKKIIANNISHKIKKYAQESSYIYGDKELKDFFIKIANEISEQYELGGASVIVEEEKGLTDTESMAQENILENKKYNVKISFLNNNLLLSNPVLTAEINQKLNDAAKELKNFSHLNISITK